MEWSAAIFAVVNVELLELLFVLRKEYASGKDDLSFFPSTPSIVRFFLDPLEEDCDLLDRLLREEDTEPESDAPCCWDDGWYDGGGGPP
jgi:hypothetical protein